MHNNNKGNVSMGDFRDANDNSHHHQYHTHPTTHANTAHLSPYNTPLRGHPQTLFHPQVYQTNHYPQQIPPTPTYPTIVPSPNPYVQPNHMNTIVPNTRNEIIQSPIAYMPINTTTSQPHTPITIYNSPNQYVHRRYAPNTLPNNNNPSPVPRTTRSNLSPNIPPPNIASTYNVTRKRRRNSMNQKEDIYESQPKKRKFNQSKIISTNDNINRNNMLSDKRNINVSYIDPPSRDNEVKINRNQNIIKERDFTIEKEIEMSNNNVNIKCDTFRNSLDFAHFKELQKLVYDVMNDSMHIPHAICGEIAGYATGKVIQCNNPSCKNKGEIFMTNEIHNDGTEKKYFYFNPELELTDNGIFRVNKEEQAFCEECKKFLSRCSFEICKDATNETDDSIDYIQILCDYAFIDALDTGGKCTKCVKGRNLDIGEWDVQLVCDTISSGYNAHNNKQQTYVSGMCINTRWK